MEPLLPAPAHPRPTNSPSPRDDKTAHHRHQSLRTEHASKPSHGRGHDSVISQPWSPHNSGPPSLRNSVSSAGHRHGYVSETRLAPDALRVQTVPYPSQAHLDPEKNGYYSLQSPRTPTRVSVSRSGLVVYDHTEYQEKGPEDKAWQVLLYLSGPCALLSLVLALWAFISILISLVLAPLRLYSSRSSFGLQITKFLGPSLNLQLQPIYSEPVETSYSSSMLVVVHLFSPIIAFGVALAAWTSAAFWIFTSILGDPGGNDGHNDGKESILAVRNWWENWLSRALRETTA